MAHLWGLVARVRVRACVFLFMCVHVRVHDMRSGRGVRILFMLVTRCACCPNFAPSHVFLHAQFPVSAGFYSFPVGGNKAYAQYPCVSGYYCGAGVSYPCPAGTYGQMQQETDPLCAASPARARARTARSSCLTRVCVCVCVGGGGGAF
jgi:hypothetical protein